MILNKLKTVERDGGPDDVLPRARRMSAENVSELSQQELAAYVCDVLLELRGLAKKAGLKYLVYLLEIAFEEAFTRSQRNKNEDEPSLR